jgi:hypothetical protein
MTIVQKSGKYYYKINQNGKKTRISKEKYNKITKKGSAKQKKTVKNKKKTVKNKKKIVKNKKKTVKNKKNKYMKGGSIENFFFNLESKNNDIVEIGSGGFGIVYLDKTQPTSVFKVSKKNNTCREWKKESDIYNLLMETDIDTKLCKIVKMKQFLNTEVMCCMELTRAYNPIGNDEDYTIQPQFQYTNLYYKDKVRGLFLGVNDLIKMEIFTKENISNYIKELGIIMARLHYKLKNDGYDIELFISKIEGEETNIYIGDFDLTQFYEDPDIKRLAWCFRAVPYFPIEGELYDIFSTNYINEAKKYNMGEIAELVLTEYTSDE